MVSIVPNGTYIATDCLDEQLDAWNIVMVAIDFGEFLL